MSILHMRAMSPPRCVACRRCIPQAQARGATGMEMDVLFPWLRHHFNHGNGVLGATYGCALHICCKVVTDTGERWELQLKGQNTMQRLCGECVCVGCPAHAYTPSPHTSLPFIPWTLASPWRPPAVLGGAWHFGNPTISPLYTR